MLFFPMISNRCIMVYRVFSISFDTFRKYDKYCHKTKKKSSKFHREIKSPRFFLNATIPPRLRSLPPEVSAGGHKFPAGAFLFVAKVEKNRDLGVQNAAACEIRATASVVTRSCRRVTALRVFFTHGWPHCRVPKRNPVSLHRIIIIHIITGRAGRHRRRSR
jgi:hypothetical protein